MAILAAEPQVATGKKLLCHHIAYLVSSSCNTSMNKLPVKASPEDEGKAKQEVTAWLAAAKETLAVSSTPSTPRHECLNNASQASSPTSGW